MRTSPGWARFWSLYPVLPPFLRLDLAHSPILVLYFLKAVKAVCLLHPRVQSNWDSQFHIRPMPLCASVWRGQFVKGSILVVYRNQTSMLPLCLAFGACGSLSVSPTSHQLFSCAGCWGWFLSFLSKPLSLFNCLSLCVFVVLTLHINLPPQKKKILGVVSSNKNIKQKLLWTDCWTLLTSMVVSPTNLFWNQARPVVSLLHWSFVCPPMYLLSGYCWDYFPSLIKYSRVPVDKKGQKTKRENSQHRSPP